MGTMMNAETALFKRRWENSENIRDGMHKVIQKQLAEIARLRAALKEIADMPPLIQYAGVEEKPIVYDAEQRIARKALSNEQNENGNG